MAKRTRKATRTKTKAPELVVVTIAEDWDHAKDCEALLKNNEIPAEIREQNDPETQTLNIVVMVPDEYLDEAHVIIEAQDAYDDFYDFSFDEDDDDYGDGFFDDDF